MNLRGHIHCLASTFFEAFEIMTLPSEILEHKFSINKDIFQHTERVYYKQILAEKEAKKKKNVTRDEEECFIMIKGSIFQEDIHPK